MRPHSRRVVFLVTLNVRNVFHSVRCADMLDTLENCFHLLDYLLCISRDCLRDCSLFYEALESQRRLEIASGVAQSSKQSHWLSTFDCVIKVVADKTAVGGLVLSPLMANFGGSTYTVLRITKERKTIDKRKGGGCLRRKARHIE